MSVIKIRSRAQYDSNIYLVKGERCVLIDSGTGEDSAGVIANLKAALDGKELYAVISTHCHFDHVGGLADVVERFSCLSLAGPDAGEITRAGPTALAELVGMDLKPVETREMAEGEIIDLGDHRLRVIYTPGHTPGGICLYDEVTGDLFSGDTVFNPGIGRTDFPGGSMKELVDSLRKLSKIEIKSLYPGHGLSADDGNRAVIYGLRMTEDYYEED